MPFACPFAVRFAVQHTTPIERLVDLLDPTANVLLNMTLDEAVQRVGSGDPEAVRGIDGQFALIHKQGQTIRMARSIGRPMRYFLAKRAAGPCLIVAERIDEIHAQLRREGLAGQFHPSYTRMVPGIEGACVPYPRFVAAGELAIDGLGDRVALTFENDIQRYESEDTLYVARLNGPAGGLLAEGAAIAVTAGGSDQVPAFTGQVAGTDPVRSHLQPGEVLQLPSDGDVRLEWRPGPAGARVRLVLRTSETGHGMPPNEKLVCDVADQGSLVIPGSLIGQLPEMRWLESGSGYAGGLPLIPSGLIRYRTSTVDTDAGRVELIAATETLFWAIH